MPFEQFTIRILVALVCGLAIGFERQLHHKNAGTKTNGLVAMGAAIFVLLSWKIVPANSGELTRVIGQVVTGVGFLCAGVIFHQGVNVQGLTTAATVWCSTAIGCLAASGFLKEAAICTIIVIIVNVTLRFLDEWVDKKEANEKNTNA